MEIEFSDYVLSIAPNIGLHTGSLEDEEIERLSEEVVSDAFEFGDSFLGYLPLFVACVEGDKELTIKYIEHYFEEAKELRDYYQYEHSGYGANNMYLYDLEPHSLYLCHRYFLSINDMTRAKLAALYLLEGVVTRNENAICERHLELAEYVEDLIYSDWLALHPRITLAYADRYLIDGMYEKSVKWVEIGSNLDYEGRQSIEPFAAVGMNQYFLGMRYKSGIGVEKDISHALELFEKAARNIGQDSLPIVGDIYYDRGDFEEAYYAYKSYNPYNEDLDTYIAELNYTQKERLEKLLEERIASKEHTFEFLSEVKNLYQYRLDNPVEAKEYYDKLVQCVLSMPLEKRNSRQDTLATDTIIQEYVENACPPTENTGKIPNDLKIGDVITFGRFNNEPIEWKVWDFNEDGSAFLVSKKILFKMYNTEVSTFLNTDFLRLSFTEEEISHIKHGFFEPWYGDGDTYLYIPDEKQFEEYEGTYEPGTIEETEFAKKMAAIKDVSTLDHGSIKPNGERNMFRHHGKVFAVRPAMDVFINVEDNDTNS